MVILGIDPGTAATGWGIIEAKVPKNKNSLVCINYGCIKTYPSSSPGDRLVIINSELKKLIKKYRPKTLAIEKLFFFKNLKTAMPVSQAKGVILMAAAENGIPVLEFTPPQVKMAMVGYGRAEKIQIQKIIKSLLRLKELPRPDDAADALAIAISCAYFLKKA
ncbi:MAG: crossover junction endodeoxyribonuclease RuvC [Candidatus Parcubacteria bacterium]|nr:crossover junction endodeoxyribonuclease RuvC [Candidatus Parcubacteria bacterium]